MKSRVTMRIRMLKRRKTQNIKKNERKIKRKTKKKTVKQPKYPTCRTISSPKPLYDAMSCLSSERKKYLKEMGYYVVDYFHTPNMELRLQRGSIKVTRQKVHEMLGVPMRKRKLEDLEPREFDD